jgi:large subunit ribosomal protein L10
MAKQEKATAVAELTEGFRQSNAAVLTEYRGLTVVQLKELRRSLGADTTYSVVKNTLTKIAAREAGLSAFDDLLQGPSAIAFVKGDPVEAAKGLRDFARTHPMLVIKGAVLDGRAISVDEVRQLADLESREVLLARLAGAFNASLQQAVSLFAAPLSQAARAVDALRQKAEADPSVLRGGAGTPPAAAAEAEAAPAAVAEPEPAPATVAASDAQTPPTAVADSEAQAAPTAVADSEAQAAPAAGVDSETEGAPPADVAATETGAASAADDETTAG